MFTLDYDLRQKAAKQQIVSKLLLVVCSYYICIGAFVDGVISNNNSNCARKDLFDDSCRFYSVTGFYPLYILTWFIGYSLPSEFAERLCNDNIS